MKNASTFVKRKTSILVWQKNRLSKKSSQNQGKPKTTGKVKNTEVTICSPKRTGLNIK